ncbi:MAG: PAS domain S-box protein [Chloroflexi bacterium]|nr:PAS domain S-box protein [Chloroflexota bacterium]
MQRLTPEVEANALRTVAEALNRAAGLKEALAISLDVALSLVGSETGWIVLLNEEGGWQLAAARGLPPALEADNRAAMRWADCTCLRKLAADELGGARVIECERIKKARGGKRGLRRHVSVPICANGQQLGNVNLALPAGREVSDKELLLLTTIGNQISVAVHRAQLYERAKTRRVDEETALLRLSQSLLSESDPQRMMDTAARAAAEALQTELAAIALVDENGQTFSGRANVGWPPEIFLHLRQIPLTENTGLTHAIRNSAPLIIPDESRETRFGPPPWIEQMGITSSLLVPMLVAGRAVGGVVVNSRTKRDWSEDDVRLLSLIANTTAQALERMRLFDSVGQSERKFRALIENSYDAITLLDAGGNLIYNSPSLPRITGRAPEETLGQNFAAVLHPDDLPAAADLFARLLQSPGVTLQTQVRVRHKDGTWRWVEAIGTNLLDDPSVGAIAANYHDITERKQAEDALRESEERYRTLVEYASDGIFLSDAQGRYLDVNPRACDMLGYSREELLSMSIADLIAPEELAARPIRFDELRAGKALISERQLRRRDGSLLEVEISARMLPDGRLQGIARDITERKRVEEERDAIMEQMRAGRERLQAVSQQLLDAEEAERRRIALDLHDEVVQTLTGLRLLLQPAPGVPPETLAARLGEAQQIVEELVARVEELSLDLRPAALDDMGLLPTLLDHFERYTARTGVRVACKHTGFQRRFPPQIEIAAYRLVQAALTNVARHARVADAIVRLWANADSLSVQVEDSGAGFDPAAPLTGGFTTGLSGMRERARLLGGDLTLESASGGGARLTAEFPLAGPVERREPPR